MPKLSQRLRVWRGEIRRTTGGLTRQDLMKNKNGKIVSKRKSLAATKANNLGSWVRAKGDSFGGKPKAYPKKGTKAEAVDLTKEAKIPLAPPKKKKKLTSKLTVVSKQLKAEATKAARKNEKAQKPKGKKIPKPKKIDVIDLTTLKAAPKAPAKKEELDFLDFSMF